jgi:hypothetical protein
LIAHHAFPKVQFGDANRRVKGINQSIEWLLATDETFMDVVKIVNKYTRYYFGKPRFASQEWPETDN